MHSQPCTGDVSPDQELRLLAELVEGESLNLNH